jgi:putative hydrolase of the HAD superfamily
VPAAVEGADGTQADVGTVPAPGSLWSPDGRSLLVDYAGVLTPGVVAAWRRFEDEHGIPARTVARMLWDAYQDGQRDNPVARLELGELPVAEFEAHLAAALRDAGHEVQAAGLVERLFADLRPAGGVWQLVRDVRARGVPAVLVSNSWGVDGYPEALLRATFDDLVISGRVGMRKPGRGILEHAVSLVGGELSRSVLVDDGPANVEAATSYGMAAVLHRGDAAATRDAVLGALGLA